MPRALRTLHLSFLKLCSFNCCVSSSRCASISATKSFCLRFRRNIALALPGLGSQNPPDGRRQSPPLGRFFDKLFAARQCKRVRSEEHTSELQSRENLVC